MIPISSKLKQNLSVVAAFVFVYLLLFEFILPVNKILPKPSLLLESYASLWVDYDLGAAFLASASAVYFSLLVSFVLLFIVRGALLKAFIEIPGLFEWMKIFRYFPAFFYAILFAFWFPASFTAEFLFLTVAAFFFMAGSLFKSADKVKQEYLLSASSLRMNPDEIYSEIYWKSLLPELFRSIISRHYYLWVLLMIFEFVGNVRGFGSVYRLLLEYQDIAGIFSLALLISLIILAGSLLIKFFNRKLAFWEP